MKQKIKVLQVSPSLGGGGVPVMLLNWYRYMDHDRIHFDFTTFAEAGTNELFTDEVLSYGSKIYYLKGKEPNKRAPLLGTFLQIKKILKNNEYDIVHSHLNGFSLIILTAAMISGIKVRISHSHAFYNRSTLMQSVKMGTLNFGLKNIATCYCACSKKAGKYLFGDDLMNNNKVNIIKNGIDAKKFAYNQDVRDMYRSMFNLQDKFVIGHVGRIDYSKNHNFLIDIFYEIYKTNKDSRLVLVGDGDLKDEVQRKVNNLRIEDVVMFLGARKDVHNLLQMFDVFLFPSRNEGFGIAPLEAQAAGLKTFVSEAVASEVKVTDLIEFISLNKDASYWAKKVGQFKKRGYKRENTYQLIKEAGYDLESVANYVENLYYNELRISNNKSFVNE